MCAVTLQIIVSLYHLFISTAPRRLCGVVCVLFKSNHDFAGPSVTGFSIQPLRYATSTRALVSADAVYVETRALDLSHVEGKHSH